MVEGELETTFDTKVCVGGSPIYVVLKRIILRSICGGGGSMEVMEVMGKPVAVVE